ncbi:MAG: FAD-binding monooxygenase, partial [Actinomycetia bacterium]|nr:FAD-binding monooxygenase [Actinomycetes bacterium]
MPTTLGRHAVVLGASMAGLLAARVLTEAFERVTIVERDELPAGPVDRRGVPQALQVHALLPRGNRILEELFPGLTERAVADGALTADGGARLRMVLGGHRLARTATGDVGLFASRLLLEHHVRGAVRAIPCVTVRDGCDVLRPVADGSAVTGVEIRRHDGTAPVEILAADLVVDATGRGSRTPVWLAEMGRTAPPEDRIVVDVGYVTGRFRLRPGALDGDVGILVSACPGTTRGGGLFAVEDGECTAGLAGTFGDHPPTDLAGFLDFAGTLAVPDMREALVGAELLGPLRPARFPANVRRRYDRLTDLPERYLVVGDALCGFNPIYGQGMTIAAIEAELLQGLLAKGAIPAARTWFTAAIRALTPAWDLATGSDLLDPRVEGPRSAVGGLVNSYVARFQAAAVHDAELSRVFSEVSGMLTAPPALMRPDRMAKVLWATR